MAPTGTRRIQALRARLAKENLDALIVLTNEDRNKNIRYLTGFGGSFGALLVSKRACFLATDGRYGARAREETRGCRIALIESAKRRERHGAGVIAPLLSLAALPRASRVGFESHRISVAMLAAWKRALSVCAVRLVPIEGAVERLRQYKDKEEIAKIAYACRITDAIFRFIIPRIREGVRERDIAATLDHELRLRGANAPSFPTIVASGPNSAIPHHETGRRKLRAGDPVVIDFGGVFPGGYCSDLSRTIFVPGKRPHAKLTEIFDIVLEANRRARKGLRPGMMWNEYNRGPARAHIESKGYGGQFLHSLGHSMGLDVHDPFDYAHDKILPGTVLTDEPGIYIEGLGGVRIEDDLLVTARGAERLTRAPYF